ncbi:MAG: D-alanyl-D-alanine carboxypeptidase [Micromonosporaceae bacterium]
MSKRLSAGMVAAATAAMLVVSAVPARARPGGGTVPPARAAALQAALDAVHAAGMPGLFAEVRDGGAVWRGVSGLADVSTGAPMQPGFEHRIGSLSKTFVATVLLQLVGGRRLGLDDPIGRYVSDLVPADLGASVTIRMLLQHTSGIGDYAAGLFRSLDDIARYQYQTFSPQQLVALGLSLTRTNAPGAGWSYSNTNYILAGLIIQRVTGFPVEAEVARRILLPLGLTHTYFPGTVPYLIGPHSLGYVPWPDGTLRDFSVYNMSWGWAAGAAVSTTADVNNFYAALLSGRLLRPDLLAAMQATVPENPADPAGTGYGLGLVAARASCGTAWGHGGGVFGYGTQVLRMADGSHEVTVADNMTLYEPAGVVGPIDVALIQFLLVALCGTTGNAAASKMSLSN